MRKSQTEPAVLTAQGDASSDSAEDGSYDDGSYDSGNMMMVLTIILMVIRQMMEVTTPVIMTIPDIDTIFILMWQKT